MAKKYNISSKSDMKRFQKDLTKNIMDAAAKQVNQARLNLVCPKCSAKFVGRVGPNTCPGCSTKITINPMS